MTRDEQRENLARAMLEAYWGHSDDWGKHNLSDMLAALDAIAKAGFCVVSRDDVLNTMQPFWPISHEHVRDALTRCNLAGRTDEGLRADVKAKITNAREAMEKER